MNAPTFDRLLRYFKHGHLNPSAPTERIKSAMEPLFAATRDVEHHYVVSLHYALLHGLLQ